MLKKLLTALLVLCPLFFGTGAQAQRITDSSYRTIGHIKSDGTVQDGSYRIIGHIKRDGTVQDSSYRIIGHIKDDGTVQDSSYRIIGHADDIPKEWAAWYFFFF